MSSQPPSPTTKSFPLPSVSASVASTFSLPSYTPYGAPKSDEHSSNAVLNYFFFLLAILVVILIIAYYSFMRRRRQRQAHNRSGGQSALARDLETLPAGARRTRREEGLDERGEAPPPYVPKELEAAVIRGQAVELHGVAGGGREPPGYQETESRQ